VSQGDEEYLAKLREDAAEAKTLFSNAKKPERERMVVRAFLRCIGEQFADDEIRIGTDEPVDVAVHDARFQIREILGDRRRGRELQERERRYEEAERLSDLLEPFTASEPFSLAEAAQFVAEALAEKASHYGVANCAKLDALVYVNLKGRHLYPKPDQLAIDRMSAAKFDRQGWRSVSILSLPYGVVLVARSDSPQFLQDKVGCILKCWPHVDGWFDP
jgi:hypothetical protein